MVFLVSGRNLLTQTESIISAMTLNDFQEEMIGNEVKGFVMTLVAKARSSLLENVICICYCFFTY